MTSRSLTTDESEQLDRALCELLGIDPEQTTKYVVERSAGDPKVTIRWEGLARIDADVFRAAMDRATTQP